DALEAVAGRTDRHVFDAHLLCHRHADGVLVVLAEEHDGELVDAREVQRLVPVALTGRTLPEPAADDTTLAAVPERVRDPGRMGKLCGDRRRVRDDPQTPRAPVGRHLASAGRRVIPLAEYPQ